MKDILDVAVKLASAGSSGVCIFAILWTGWLMKDLPHDADARATLFKFMQMCIAIAIVAGVTGAANALYNAHEANKLRGEANKLRAENIEYQKQLSSARATIGSLLNVKESVIGQLPQDDARVDQLKNTLLSIDRGLEKALQPPA